MNETANIMKKEIRLIAGYRALIISRYILTTLLGIITLYLGQKNYAVSSLYVLIILNTCPYILIYALKDYAKNSSNKFLKAVTEEKEFKLKLLKSKYKYSNVSYFANSVSYILALLLICLWQLNYNRTMYGHPFLKTLPLEILVFSLVVLVIGVIFYQIRIPYIIRHNKL